MSYINDPRENIQNPETGYVLESENRNEEMYKWSGKILDLCDLPVEEYMKPMTVIALGGGVLPDTGETMYTLKFVIDGVVVGQEKLISGDPIIFNIDAVKEDRNFLGWYYGGTKYEEGALMPSKNLTLTAKYECDVKFIFIVDGIEEEISAYTVDYNTTLNKTPSVNMPGFEFKGWEPSINNPVTSHTVYYATFESTAASIYYGSFKVARADYDSGNTSQYFNSEDVENPEIFGSILTADCITKGTFILKIPVDNDYSLSKRKLYWRPYVYLVPKNVANIFTLYDGIDNNITSTLVTDNKTLIYKGHEYIMFVYQTQATLIGNTVQELPQSIILK